MTNPRPTALAWHVLDVVRSARIGHAERKAARKCGSVLAHAPERCVVV
jgi:hypothetical protein